MRTDVLPKFLGGKYEHEKKLKTGKFEICNPGPWNDE